MILDVFRNWNHPIPSSDELAINFTILIPIKPIKEKQLFQLIKQLTNDL